MCAFVAGESNVFTELRTHHARCRADGLRGAFFLCGRKRTAALQSRPGSGPAVLSSHLRPGLCGTGPRPRDVRQCLRGAQGTLPGHQSRTVPPLGRSRHATASGTTAASRTTSWPRPGSRSDQSSRPTAGRALLHAGVRAGLCAPRIACADVRKRLRGRCRELHHHPSGAVLRQRRRNAAQAASDSARCASARIS